MKSRHASSQNSKFLGKKKKLSVAATSSIKLRTKPYKPVAKRTRDKSPKELKAEAFKSLEKCKKKKENLESNKTKKIKSPANEKCKKVENKAQLQKKSKVMKSKSTKQKELKEKLKRMTCSNSFLDFWGAKVIGKREASLNASVKVNIMYEKLLPLKSQTKPSAKKTEPSSKRDKEDGDRNKNQVILENSDSSKNNLGKIENVKLKANESKDDQKSTSTAKFIGKNKASSPTNLSKKRKTQESKNNKDEPSEKKRKSSVKGKSKTVAKKKKKKSVPSGHQLSNIIEKSPRQASLIAKAMIALEQEEETVVVESAARTRVFDWAELNMYTPNQRRQMIWKSGLGNESNRSEAKNTGSIIADKDEVKEIDVSVSTNDIEENSILKTLHHVGDNRILKEYLRAQKEDFQGPVDVEKCFTPEKLVVTSPSPKKTVTPISEEKSEKISSPVKPQTCRVATPIPQLPVSHRTSHMTSYIHHPIPQPVYPQQHSLPQPIKVPPSYNPPAYIYQYAMDRQQGLYVPPSPSPVPFGVSNPDIASDFSSPYTLSPMGALSLRRGSIHPYNPSLHLPVQHISGYNYSPFYSAPIQSLSQPNASTLQALHQRFPLVQPQPVIHALPQDLGSYPPGYQSYSQITSLGQDASCMPPPPPPAHSHRAASIGQSHHSSVSPMESLRSMNPVGVQPIVNSPVLDFTNTSDCQNMNPHRPLPHLSYSKSGYHHPANRGSGSPAKYVVSVTGHNLLAQCKKEKDDYSSNCEVVQKNNACSNESVPRTSIMRRKSAESSDVSDLLHSAHSAMYQIDGMNTSDIHQPTSSGGSSVGKTSPKINVAGQTSFNASYSVSSILDMPSCKIKPEPDHKVYLVAAKNNNNNINISNNNISAMYTFNKKQIESPSVNNSQNLSLAGTKKNIASSDLKMETIPKKSGSDQLSVLHQPSKEYFNRAQNTSVNVTTNSQSKAVDVSIIPSHKSSVDFVAVKTQTQFAHPLLKSQKPNMEYFIVKPQISVVNNSLGNDFSTIKQQKSADEKNVGDSQPMTSKPVETKAVSDVIVIEDTDDSSDDEPLAKLVKAKISDVPDTADINCNSKTKVKLSKSNDSSLKDKSKSKSVKKNDSSINVTFPKILAKDKILSHSKSVSDVSRKPAIKSKDDVGTYINPTLTIAVNDISMEAKSKHVKKSSLVSLSKSKKLCKKVKEGPIFPVPIPRTNTNHGWTWVGEGEMRAIPKLTLSREEHTRVHKCYRAIQHSSGEVVSVKDCVILQSDGDGNVPYVARVTCLWENTNGEMMFSMLWYYQPEHTLQGREPEDGDQELFASKHREENSVACIDDKCYVVMYNEYCRLEAEAARMEQGVALPKWRLQLSIISEEDEKFRRPKPPANACAENIWFCRYDYDVRKKIVKKPKNKKSNLRYRSPVKNLK